MARRAPRRGTRADPRADLHQQGGRRAGAADPGEPGAPARRPGRPVGRRHGLDVPRVRRVAHHRARAAARHRAGPAGRHRRLAVPADGSRHLRLRPRAALHRHPRAHAGRPGDGAGLPAVRAPRQPRGAAPARRRRRRGVRGRRQAGPAARRRADRAEAQRAQPPRGGLPGRQGRRRRHGLLRPDGVGRPARAASGGPGRHARALRRRPAR